MQERAYQTPNNPALIHANVTFTYQSLYERVIQVAGSLIKSGLQPGDRVLVSLPNNPEFVIAYLVCRFNHHTSQCRFTNQGSRLY